MTAQQQAAFRNELNGLRSWQERSKRINQKFAETSCALATRNQKLLALRPDFDALSLSFWRAFASSLGCEDPAQTIVTCQKKMRSPGCVVGFGTVVFVSALLCIFWHDNALMTVLVGVIGTIGIAILIAGPRRQIAHARKVAAILAREQQPFWLTSATGNIALSNESLTPPQGAKWLTPERVTFLFLRHIAPRWTIDALTGELIWQNSTLSAHDHHLSAGLASQILKDLLSSDPRYRQMVDDFAQMAGLENDISFLDILKAEAEAGLAAELREAEQRVEELRKAQQKAPGSRQRQEEHNRDIPAQAVASANRKASWDTLIIPTSLRENLQAYCRILRDFEAYRNRGVHLPKGLLLFGPPGCGKTQIAKTLSAQAGLNFVALSTSDCKAMFIGRSADRLAKVFKEAREKQPSLIFVDELDAVCPIRGAYHDCISQEFTAQLLQEIDGINSDSQAIFLVGATNRPDQVDSAILSRFSERIEIPLPDTATRAALLSLFLGPLSFSGDKTRVIRRLALASVGANGRDLRSVVNQAVLSAVKRTSSPQNFALAESDFTSELEDTGQRHFQGVIPCTLPS
jgi:hypothetical protein